MRDKQSDPDIVELPAPAAEAAPCQLFNLAGSAFGVPLRILVDDASLHSRVAEFLPHQFQPADCGEASTSPGPTPQAQTFRLRSCPPDNLFRTYSGEELTLESADAEEALAQLGRDLMVHVADLAPDRVFLHAGVVAWGTAGLLLPGTSFAGKTTLVAELLRAGATYYSDEYAVIDEAGLVHPYTRDLQMRQPGASGQRGVSPASLNATVGCTPLRITHLLFARYVPGSRWHPVPVSPGMAVLEMLLHAIPVQRTPARVMSTLHRVVAGARCWRAERDEVGPAAHILLEALASGSDLA